MTYKSREEIISSRIRMLVEQQDVPAYKLAKEMGVSKTTFSNWMQGVCLPSQQNLFKLAEKLGCETGYLTTLEQTEPTRENTDIALATGLSDKAIDRLKGLQDGNIYGQALSEPMLALISSFIENVDVARLANLINMSSRYNANRLVGQLTNDNEIDASKYFATRDYSKIIDEFATSVDETIYYKRWIEHETYLLENDCINDAEEKIYKKSIQRAEIELAEIKRLKSEK